MKKWFLFLCFVAVFLLCGCRSQLVTVDVIPSDAHVIANGVAYNNKSPIFIEAETGKQLAITAYKDGYREKIHVIDYQLSKFGKICAWTSILVLPSFGLFCDNAWELKQNNISIRLEPVSEAAQKESMNTAAGIVPVNQSVSSADRTSDKKAREIFNEL